jgi:hypothetical protein
VPRFGAKAITNIGAAEIARFILDIEKLGRPETTKTVRKVLGAMFQAAAEDPAIGVRVNPVRGVKVRQMPRQRRIAFSHDEADRFLMEIPEHYHLLIDTILGSGCLPDRGNLPGQGAHNQPAAPD